MNVDLVIQAGPTRYCPTAADGSCAVNPNDGTICVAPKCVVDLAGEGVILATTTRPHARRRPNVRRRTHLHEPLVPPTPMAHTQPTHTRPMNT